MYPVARQLLARTYLAAAVVTGIIVGYTIARIEVVVHRDVLTETTRESAPPEATATARHSISVSTGNQIVGESLDDLELAARRLDERARKSDRLGDPKLATMWREEASRLRDELVSREMTSTSAAALSQR